ncbi:MAG: cobalamin-dependent protein [Cyclobacteriaceae bacterium]|nr:cobalamin-dependent protein [Cyclobacteriaceae bacterium]
MKKDGFKIRVVCATSLYDGHDAAISIMRRIMQHKGAEVIHLGHNRSAEEIVKCAIQEDAQGIAVTSYQGGHIEFYAYMYDLLKEQGCNIKITGGGGGTILPEEVDSLHSYGISRIYSPEDGRKMGLEGMVDDLLKICSFDTLEGFNPDIKDLKEPFNDIKLSKWLSWLETQTSQNGPALTVLSELAAKHQIPVIGITGTGGSGKSSLTDELTRRFYTQHPGIRIAILSADPSKRKSGGALLGDRIRINMASAPGIFMRSMATRGSGGALSKASYKAIDLCKIAGFDLIFLESSGIGQSGAEITDLSDLSLYVMTPEYGAASQLEKIDMIDYADAIAVNKVEKAGGEDALRDVIKQYRRSHGRWDTGEAEIPVIGTSASQFGDSGTDNLYNLICKKLSGPFHDFKLKAIEKEMKALSGLIRIIPSDRKHYLAEVKKLHNQYHAFVDEQAMLASRLYQLEGAEKQLNPDDPATVRLKEKINAIRSEMDQQNLHALERWDQSVKKYQENELQYEVRNQKRSDPLWRNTLSGTAIPRIAVPVFSDWGDRLRWKLTENFPGRFPYTSGVFPLRRSEEMPTRMFAGEGGPERTNIRFHYLSENQPAIRLSTAFDSVTLYGENPDMRPDIYGKIGNAGVSIATLDDMKKLYSGFDLCAANTSVSMTINGPAPYILAMFLQTAIDQQCEKYIRAEGLTEQVETSIKSLIPDPPHYQGNITTHHSGLGLMLLGTTADQILPLDIYEKIKSEALQKVRGTVQADILKEDQAQNTCIFSTGFALRMMGDVQEYFIENKVRNFYSVSISGYHMAEAGANPITQLAFTLANAFTYVEYYRSRGMEVDDFAQNLSFFFSNGMDAEYAVLGRVARKIWAVAMRYLYKGNARSQKLKYHIQTSGRSLHAREMDFNDIRTTLQALYALYDNCNSLHTNAYDEAVTTPTESSVRRALAIQLIIDKELGLYMNENMHQGSFIIKELTHLVEEAVLKEFENIDNRGGVLQAMERMYQRSKIQEESMLYEQKKQDGSLPLVGINTFTRENKPGDSEASEVIRASDEEKKFAIESLKRFQTRNKNKRDKYLKNLHLVSQRGDNIFNELMQTVKYCSLGEITKTLYESGGQYRRNM